MSLRIKIYGEFSVETDGEMVTLPSSKKVRGLLAYLALTGRPHRRETLCDLFFDTNDDPRAQLRWGLTKIRPLLPQQVAEKLSDRERVTLASSDVEDVRSVISNLLAATQTPDVAAMEAAFKETDDAPLSGLDIPRLQDYQAWLEAEREELRRLRTQLATRIASSDAAAPDLALQYAKYWSHFEPWSTAAADTTLALLDRLGRHGETESLEQSYTAAFTEAGIEWQRSTPQFSQPKSAPRRYEREQTVRFCRAADQTTIAWSSAGEGPPLVKAANWLTHLEFDWSSPLEGEQLRLLAERNTLIRYDGRGNGLSDWEVPEISLDRMVSDLETVVEAAGIDQFPLMGISQGAAVAIEYAARHPERVTHLVFHGGYAAGWRTAGSADEVAQYEAVKTLAKMQWGSTNISLRQLISSAFMPQANEAEVAWFSNFQREATTAENASRFIEAFGEIDVRDRLQQIRAPTLIMHSKGDEIVSLAQARELASHIPNAKFISLDSNHHFVIDREPAMMQMIRSLIEFIGS